MEDQNIAIEWRWARGEPARFPAFAAELVRLKVDVIITEPNPATLAAQRATKTIPIVMVLATDPVHLGFVPSPARPGGDITRSVDSNHRGSRKKNFEVLKEFFPTLSRVAVLSDSSEPGRQSMVDAAEVSAPALGATLMINLKTAKALGLTIPQSLLVRADGVRRSNSMTHGGNPMNPKIVLPRRSFLRVSGAAGGAALVALPIRRFGGRPAHAQVSAPPVVDRLAVRVVVDGYHDAIARSTKVGTVDVQRVGVVGLTRSLHSEHGLSLNLESQRGGETRRFLLDFGFTSGALLNNLEILKVDPASLDALIISHGHFDHFGGLLPFLQANRARMRPDIALFAGGEDTFCYRWIQPPSGQRVSFGVLDRRQLAAAKVRVVMAGKPAIIEGHAFSTGAIPRTGFEKVLPATVVEIGMRDGAGCDASHFSKEEQAGKIVFDQFSGEHATCFHVKDRGLVVISSCGHAGLINSIRQAQAVSGVQKVHAAVGGFHLSPAPEPYIVQTVQALKEIDPDYVIPMHCSGANFIRIAQQEMPNKVIASYTGSRYTFGA